MPAFVLTCENQTLERYDVVGEHSAGTARFVKHVALHKGAACAISLGQRVTVVHMGPPLQTDGEVAPHAAGRVPLTVSEIAQISVWVDQVADEHKRAGTGPTRQYVIDPPWQDRRDPNTGVRRYRRYSCAGFVLDAHHQVGIKLLDLDKTALPDVYEKTLRSAYPDAPIHRLRAFGLLGKEPWRIVLGGYVLHSLSRPSTEIRIQPYRAREGDEQF
jgi:hypothetical protein